MAAAPASTSSSKTMARTGDRLCITCSWSLERAHARSRAARDDSPLLRAVSQPIMNGLWRRGARIVTPSARLARHRSAQAAAGQELLAGEPAGVVRRQEDRNGRDIADPAGAAERHLRQQGLFEVGADEAGGVRALGLDHAGVD